MVEQTIEELKDLIADNLDVNIHRDSINPDEPLLEEGLKLDSLAIVELITLSEEKFGIQFGENDLTMDAFANLRSLAGVISSLRTPALA